MERPSRRTVECPGAELGIPQESRDAFGLLERSGQLDPKLGDSLKRMVGFWNVAVHHYQELNIDIVRAIIEKHLDELLAFGQQALRKQT